ncbi:CCR4-NOT transcription complex subunit 10-B isoform X2 [Cynara cardunculus var. scolymus]|uniref:CCR4-NOT transcription complex subunit 10-B isoform X2 n=1 Tax=Cynara cardunculus var. scolymus TaxID=59895 RepID=UPI000D627169|nr:CCR4-NOT transcription complex subunit 10-B isoform X2 [Cynara cardunculus var. scolymus]
MDSSSVALSNNNSRGDASSSPDADLISVTQTLAKEAYVLFQLGKYVDCLKVLNQILEKKADDPKILHNIAIVENFQDGFSHPKRFLEALDSLKAVILYHLHEYEKCFSILERLYQNIEPIDERVARHVCLLLLDVALVCHHATRAADVINYLERVGGNSLGNQGDSGSFTQQQQLTNLVMKSTSAPSNVIISDPINSDSAVNANGPESPISRTLSEETLYESLMSTLDVSGAQNLTRPSNDLTRTQADESLITTPDLRLKVHLYKVWVLILTRNLKAAKREVKMAMNIARGKDYSLALFLKSQLEYARRNHRKAIKLLMASVSQTETGTSALYNNNLGCIYYQLGKYQTSAVFFSKALGNSAQQRKERPRKLLNISQDKSVFFAYNCGLVYLASGKPSLAVRCFRQAGSVFFKRPLLWLRIAECCIMASEKKLDINVNVVGRGKWRQLVIECWNSRNTVQEEPNLSLTFAKSCLLNALHLLDCPDESKPDLDENSNPRGSNLKATGQVNSNGEVKESKVGNSSGNALLQSSINEYESLCGKENQMILQAVLADLAFVYLELGNAVKGLAAAQCLLRLAECSRVYVFLGNLYAAEAYCLLNQPKQASEHLSSYMSGQNNTELPYSQEDCDIWQMRKGVDLEEPNGVEQALPQGGSLFLKPEEARGVLLADMAAVAAAEGDMERAQEAVAVALSLIPENPEVVLTAAYVDMVRGKSEEAVGKLKECRHARFK